MNLPKIAIVVLTWNKASDVMECLESLTGLNYPDYEIIVVDNHSTDNTVEEVRKKYPGHTLIVNSSDLGYAGGNNAGLKYALGKEFKYIFVLSNDTKADPDCLRELVIIMEGDTSIGAAGPVIHDYYNTDQIILSGDKISWITGKLMYNRINKLSFNETAVEMRYLNGSAVLFRTEVLKLTGIFDEKYFLFYEDADLSLRIRQSGYKAVLAAASKIYHKESQATGWIYSPVALYYGTRNRLLFMKKYSSKLSWMLFITVFFSLSIIKNLYKWRKEPVKRLAFLHGMMDYYNNRFGARGEYL